MITVKEATSQVKRLYQLRGYPKGEEGEAARADLVKELQECESLERGKEIIDALLDAASNDTPCPTRSDLRKAVRANLEERRPDPECPKCNGEGWEHIERDGISAMGAKCDCWQRRPAQKMPPIEDRPEKNRPATQLQRLREVKAGKVLENLS